MRMDLQQQQQIQYPLPKPLKNNRLPVQACSFPLQQCSLPDKDAATE